MEFRAHLGRVKTDDAKVFGSDRLYAGMEQATRLADVRVGRGEEGRLRVREVAMGRFLMEIRNRIKGHRLVLAGDLFPHDWNYRLHQEVQQAALAALYREVGFARSLLANELPDGRLKLIDGHLRCNLAPTWRRRWRFGTSATRRPAPCC